MIANQTIRTIFTPGQLTAKQLIIAGTDRTEHYLTKTYNEFNIDLIYEFIMKTGNCFTAVVILIIIVTLFNCQREKNTLTSPLYHHDNNITISLNKTLYKSTYVVELTILNLSNRDILLGNCGSTQGFDFELKLNSEWDNLIDKICDHIYLPSVLSQRLKNISTVIY